MKNKVAFTIVSKNYLGFAEVLGNSILKYDPDIRFCIFIADEIDTPIYLQKEGGIEYLIAKDILNIDENIWDKMSFKYSLVEFCTAIKPTCFKYLFSTLEDSRIIYFDPDVLIFSSLHEIYSLLDNYSMILTPHILTVEKESVESHLEPLFLKFGIYNLGFLALKKDEKITSVLDWWENRLRSYCFFDDKMGLATDQKWANFFPNFLSCSELLISKDRGMNLAPWNFFEREINIYDNKIYVKDRTTSKEDSSKTLLKFVHFSGCNYKDILQTLWSKYIKQYADISIVFEAYKESLSSGSIDKYIGLQYSYQFYKNGSKVLPIHRRLLRTQLEDGNYSFKPEISPFSTKDNSFYLSLEKNGIISKTSTSSNVRHHPERNNDKVDLNMSKQLKIMNTISRILLKMLGPEKYSNLLLNFHKYFVFEKQSHLIKK